MTTPAHSGFSRWMTARLGEPESRAAIAGAVTALGAFTGQTISLTALGWALLFCLIMFVLPGPLAAPIIQAIEKEAGLPPVMVPSVWTAPVAAPAPQEPPHAAPGPTP